MSRHESAYLTNQKLWKSLSWTWGHPFLRALINGLNVNGKSPREQVLNFSLRPPQRSWTRILCVEAMAPCGPAAGEIPAGTKAAIRVGLGRPTQDGLDGVLYEQ